LVIGVKTVGVEDVPHRLFYILWGVILLGLNSLRFMLS
jgi:hypothetical protein